MSLVIALKIARKELPPSLLKLPVEKNIMTKYIFYILFNFNLSIFNFSSRYF